MTVVHQLVPNFAAGDAIGMHVRHVQRAFREVGIGGEIFYDDVQSAVRRHGRHYSTFDLAHDGDAGRAWMLFHLSTGSPMTDWTLAQGLPLAVDYHNITPPRFFERWEPPASDNIRRALAEARRLAPACRFAMADSLFNEEELIAMGYGRTAVAPILIDTADYDATANDRTLARLRRESGDGGARWFFIGRVVPNKCQHDLVAAFAAYRELYDPRARMALAGGRTSNVYFRSLEVLAADLGVADSVELTDTVAFPEVLAHFRAADVFVCLSEHEGFQVPAVEAMHLGVPVVAYACGAVAETVGDGGVLLPTKEPEVVAAAVHRVLSDDGLRSELRAAGRRRADDLDVRRTGPHFVETFRTLSREAEPVVG